MLIAVSLQYDKGGRENVNYDDQKTNNILRRLLSVYSDLAQRKFKYDNKKAAKEFLKENKILIFEIFKDKNFFITETMNEGDLIQSLNFVNDLAILNSGQSSEVRFA